MRKVRNLIIEGARFPIASLLIAMLLIGIGTSFTSDNQLINKCLSICTYTGGYLKQLFPIILIIGILGKNQKPAMSIVSGIACYFIILIVTMFLCDPAYESYFYQNFLGLSVSITDASTNATVIHYPINTGYISAIATTIVVRYIYRKANERSNYSISSFISNDTICLIISLVAGAIIGFICVLVFPYFVTSIKQLMSYISEYSTRFRGMFVYETTERVLDIFGFSDIYRNAFWFGAQGGNWADVYGQIYNGDINVWAAQIANKTVELGFGKYITPYYAINLFVMPTIVIIYYFKTNNKIDRRRNIGLVIIAIITSIISSSLLPIELVLFITTPLLALGHVLLSGLISAVLFKLNIHIGYTFANNVLYALPGSLLSFFTNGVYAIRDNAMLIECIVGLFASLIYVAMFIVYYEFVAFKPLSKKRREKFVDEIEMTLGGINNIQFISSGSIGIHFVAFDDEKIDFEKLFTMNFFDIKSVRYGYQMNYGAECSKIVKMILKDMKNNTNVEYKVA